MRLACKTMLNYRIMLKVARWIQDYKFRITVITDTNYQEHPV